ncbi:MAG: toll/interleukin-1 receptor domain-containing protein, partial [bacterium]|nr:toll/interleukin-1 receptor domain-containing protein [bacterium]
MTVEIFISYAHEDRDLCEQLRRQLSPLEREKRVSIWTDELISAGAEWSEEILAALERAQLVLLLVSADFLASDFCYIEEMTRALERHRAGTARVVPVILRPCEWRSTPLGELKALPRDGRPVTQWPDTDAALSDVVKGLGPVLTELSPVPDREIASGTAAPPGEDPRPSGTAARQPSPAERGDADLTRGVGWRPFRGALPTMSFEFDVFLSHNSRDKPAVRQLGEALGQRGLRVWLDEWELVPGQPWQEALEEIIATTQAAAVLVGKDGLGPWQEPEMRGCISEFVARKLPVIPVLLLGAPGEPELPIFLKQFTWVDLRDGITEEGLDRLVWGI